MASTKKLTITKNLKLSLALLPACCLTSSLPSFASNRNSIITPGLSIGRIRLRASRRSMHKMMGKPSETMRRLGRVTEEVWIRSKTTWKRTSNQHWASTFEELWLRSRTARGSKTILEREARDKIRILYEADKVIQIEVTSPRFATGNDLSTQSSYEKIDAKFHIIGNGKRWISSSYHYRIGYNSLASVFFWDDIKSGIAFKEHPTIVTDSIERYFQLEAIVVHRPGHRVLPSDVGYVSAKTYGGGRS